MAEGMRGRNGGVQPLMGSADLPLVDATLGSHADALGRDFEAYRNHVFRVLNFLFALEPGLADSPDALLVTATCHDLGIWTARTFDYLGPSCALAHQHLLARGLEAQGPEAELIIQSHHKLRAYRGPFARSVEAFRRADRVDLSLGLLPSGLDPDFVRAVRAAFPNAGFHLRLLGFSWRQFLQTPLRPLPMVRW